MLGLLLTHILDSSHRSFDTTASPPPKSPLSDISDFTASRASYSASSISSPGGGSGFGDADGSLAHRRSSDIYTSSGSTTRRSSCDTIPPSLTHFRSTFKYSPSEKHRKVNQDLAWHAINSLRVQGEDISISSLKVLCKLGQGDSGSVYLTQLRGTSFLFALKVKDKEKLLKKGKVHRLHIEREILELVDHPFLPTLYAHFEMGKFTCLLMEYCPGGDLHALIHRRQTGDYFDMKAIRFYAAQLVVALEYLHLKGIIYRDLKPENVLLREKGHIMLSDFDLSMHCCDPLPAKVVKFPISSISSSSKRRLIKRHIRPKSSTTGTGKVNWTCSIWLYLKSSWNKKQLHTMNPRQGISKKKKRPTMVYTEVMVEPVHLRTLSMVGTHEYLAPEVLGGLGHGSAVDWWMLGVLIYEMLYRTTPFKGQSTKHTLRNIKKRKLRFPLDTEVLHVHGVDIDVPSAPLTQSPVVLGALVAAEETTPTIPSPPPDERVTPQDEDRDVLHCQIEALTIDHAAAERRAIE
ncbi:hypothetical protein L7F22_036904 [Adiantum nelumboides]|nr:hypothetical protein [Adiantum nelumboides]